MKKVIHIIMAVTMIFTLASCSKEQVVEGSFKGGIYEATSTGHNGPLTVEVEVDENKIVDIRLVDSVETEGIGDVAFNKISKQVLNEQSLSVDAASGATVSSSAVISAIKDALTQAGGDVKALSKKEVDSTKGEEKEIDTDIVVIGSGAAGLSAAIEAAEGGAKVVVLEKLTRMGGSTAISSGMVVVGGSELQEEAGIIDSVENLKEYWLDRGEGNIDKDMVTFTAEEINDSLDFLINSDISYSPEGIIHSGTTDIPRAHIPKGYGAEFIDKLVKRAELLGVTIYTETPAESLLKDLEGNIIGVKARQNGAEFIVNAKATIIATGGFDHNEDLKAKYSPDTTGAWAVSAPGNTGDGLIMGMEANADTVFKGGYIGWKVVSPAYGHTTMIGRPIYGAPNLIVDLGGNRFTDESEDYPFLYKEMVKNGDEKFYFIFAANAEDTTTLEAATATIESLEAAVEAGVAFKADTISELQDISGLSNLVETIDIYNDAITKGNDDRFGRDTETMSIIGTGPFYALQSQKATLGTFGGLKVNLSSEVLNVSGDPISGLYAAGEVANGDFFSDIYPASGSSISMCVVFGREAGKNAALYVK